MKQRGFTLFELVVVVSIVGVLGVVVLDRMRFYQEAAEKAAMEQTVGIIRSAMRLQIADRLLSGGVQEVAALAQANPMDWLAQQPRNYIGVRFAPKTGEIAGGSWYFDLKEKQLVYVVSLGNHFATDHPGRKQVRFELRLVEKSTQEQAATDVKEIQGLVLAEAVPYRWF
jgi:general secretion pathway protein G